MKGELMKDLVEIALWSHEHRPWLFGPQMEAFGRTTPEPFVMQRMVEPGNCHENMRRVVERRDPRARFLLFVDWDVRPATEGWLTIMTGIFDECPRLGCLTATETKDRRPVPPMGQVRIVSWDACFFQMYDMSRVTLEPDLSIPYKMAMTDVDLCMQVWQQGFEVGKTGDVMVHHEDKHLLTASQRVARFGEEARQDPEYVRAQFAAQHKWFEEKWGFPISDLDEVVWKERVKEIRRRVD